MALTARVKDVMRTMLGDSITARLHGRRFASLARRSVRQRAELRFARKLLRSGQIAIDIGANGADWTLMMSEAVGKEGRIVAFEAHPYYAKATEHAIRRLGLENVALLALAVGEAASTVSLEVRPAHGASHSGRARIVDNVGGQRVTVEIPMIELDAYLADARISSVDFIKIDTEGYELGILRGAARTLSRCRPLLIIEVGHGWKHGFSDDDLQSLLEDAEYDCYGFDERTLTAYKLDRIHTGSKSEIRNRLLVPSEKTSKISHVLA